MGCKVEACSECTQKCLLVHGKNKKSSPVITSFFKVMIGDRFSKVLFLPPKFAPRVSALIDKETLIEDSSGKQWEVTISNLNGSFAFQQGWEAFSLDHGLEVGDFVVFHYIVGSRFVVKIYNKTGCEKLEFSQNRNQKKRARTNNNSTSKDVHTIDIVSMNKQGSNTSIVSGSDVEINQNQCEVDNMEKVQMITEITSNCEKCDGKLQPESGAEYIEEPYYIIDRNLGDKQGEDRSLIFDLSDFEKPNNNSSTRGSCKVTVGDERYPHHADTSLQFQIEAGLVNKDPVSQEVVSSALPSDASDFEIMKKNNGEEPVKYGCQNAEGGAKTQSKNDQVAVSQKDHASLINSSKSAQQKFIGMSKQSNVPVTLGVQNRQSCKKPKIAKKEHVEMTSEICGHKKMFQDIGGEEPKVIKEEHGQSSNTIVKDNDNVRVVVKSETVDLVGISSPTANHISCLIAAASEPFLVLPTCLPSQRSMGRTNRERKVVLLKDPETRLWPVLYHEKFGVRVLTSGWEAFSKANNIHQGDECIFRLESETEGIYGVHIVRK